MRGLVLVILFPSNFSLLTYINLLPSLKAHHSTLEGLMQTLNAGEKALLLIGEL